MKHILVAILVAVFGLALVVPTVSARNNDRHWGQARPYGQVTKRDYIAQFGEPENPDQLLKVKGKLILHDVSKEEVFAFLSDLENDTKIYPGTLSSARVSGDGGVGTVYEETIVFGGVQADIVATIFGYRQDRLLKFTSDGLLKNVSSYKLRRKGRDDVQLKLKSFVEVPEGVGQADMEGYLQLVLTNIMTEMNTTGEIEI